MKFIKKLLASIIIATVAGYGVAIIGNEFLRMDSEDAGLIAASIGIIVFLICINNFEVFKEAKELVNELMMKLKELIKKLKGPMSELIKKLKGPMSELIKKLKEYIDDSDNADLYAIAEEEYDREEMDKGLWSQALVKAKGDDNLRKVEYIKLRVRQLKKQA